MSDAANMDSDQMISMMKVSLQTAIGQRPNPEPLFLCALPRSEACSPRESSTHPLR